MVEVVYLMPDEREAFEERAAIMEYDGRMPREIAERRAMREILEGRKMPVMCVKCFLVYSEKLEKCTNCGCKNHQIKGSKKCEK